MKRFKFVKEQDSRWFIDIPGWPEEARDALEMVCGADTMLDIIAQGETEVWLSFSEEIFFDYKIELSYIRPEEGGAWYNLKSELHEFEVWLCQVTEYVFGKLPEKIYVTH